MPIYTLTVQIRADIEADSEDSAQQTAIDHLAQLCEASDVIDVERVDVVNVEEAYFEEYEEE